MELPAHNKLGYCGCIAFSLAIHLVFWLILINMFRVYKGGKCERLLSIIMLLLETLLLAVFLVLDIFLFYVFFESILPPLFILIGLFGSLNRVRASPF